MTLLEKIAELRESNIKPKELSDSLVGTKVSVTVSNDGKPKTIKGNFRHFQTNGQANIYLEESYKTNKGKDSKWIKIAPSMVEVL
jgi:hypothetical protein